MSSGSTDRVFPMRSFVSVDTSSTPAVRPDREDGYFHGVPTSTAKRKARATTSKHGGGDSSNDDREGELIQAHYGSSRSNPPRLPPQAFTQIVADAHEVDSNHEDFSSVDSGTTAHRGDEEAENEYTTTRFTHVMTEEGHAIITGHDGDKLQRCEDEPIHIPGAIQTFGLIIALEEEDGKFLVKIASENSEKIIGYTPRQLFALETFTDILTEEQADNLLDHIDFVRDEETDVQQNGPELFTLSVKHDKRRPVKLWCAMHINDRHPDLIICEFELENDIANPPIHPSEMTPDIPEDTLNSNPTIDEYMESTRNMSKPLRVLRSARKNRGEAAAMEVFNIMSQIQEQLANAPTIELFLKVLVGVVKELTGFHRVMIYQFDNSFNGRVVTELVDPRATKDLYKGLHFPASDIPKQARELYKINRVRLLYDRDQETARLVCRTLQDMETPLDLTHSYLRAMSPIHLKYLANMAVRSSMSISINAFNELWGLISCHSYGQRGMRVAFPIRKMCRLVGDTASRNIERLSYASRLQARKLINTIPTQRNPSGYIIASSEDLLKLFDADFGLLCIQDETKMLGNIDKIQESLAMLEYLKLRKIASVTTSQDITEDFPDLMYPPGFRDLAGMLLVPLSPSGTDFIAFFRKGQLREVKWAGNPYEKTIRDGTHSYLEPRKSFKIWSETVIRKCREWTEEEIETAAVLCLVYGKFIEVWRQKEAALQNSQLTKLLLANSAHEVRTPLNAIINYLEIALGMFYFHSLCHC
jgi:light-regulated signal transduction histidine kinase (bacteriophytochrome)